MIAMLHFATLAVVTVFAVGAAFAFDWMLLRAMFVLMQPATARRRPLAANLGRGAVQAAHAYAQHR
jgi:hypothetical protein